MRWELYCFQPFQFFVTARLGFRGRMLFMRAGCDGDKEHNDRNKGFREPPIDAKHDALSHGAFPTPRAASPLPTTYLLARSMVWTVWEGQS